MEIIRLADYNIFVGSIWKELQSFLSENSYSKIAVLVDDNTKDHCLPLLEKNIPDLKFTIIQIPSGEQHKNIQTCQYIWEKMMDAEMDRKGLLINLGGGVIGDMGGFCASTFKRGFDFIQIPTTLLSQVDASIGGKLGVDFMQIKNSIGIFNNPKAVFVDAVFLKTLSFREIRSGFAEIIKHSLIADLMQWSKIKQLQSLEGIDWSSFLVPSLKIKQAVVEKDPFEKGWRKALNFGHTIGHAVEGYALETKVPLLHGEAIAIGFITEAYLSHKKVGLSGLELKEIVQFILKIYDPKPLPESAFPTYLSLMSNDKKNENNEINFSLIYPVGKAIINQTADEILITESLRYYNNLFAN
jgi:3-dehydroquinate synthase